ncbi:hypothetical protein DDZ13_05430 [Coraliomargarita sinensis]|uniref:Lipoprotein n=1 Tax=Coraliomargarita sinensis TaxID=2174842 RepID=A0A317ZG74_9BACT|nr:hypothetical protein [Coraliomargarita sinensis]PXA04615.1 hypothetical protein DDZ13_05430 [Coraliomargarita sinensis]
MKISVYSLLLLSLTLVSCSQEKSGDEAPQDPVLAYIQAEKEYLKSLPDEVYVPLIKELAKNNEYVLEFLARFPNAYQVSSRSLMRAGMLVPNLSRSGIPEDDFIFVAELHGRYRFRCFVPFYLWKDFKRVECYGKPSFDLIETVSVERINGIQDRIRSRRVELPDGSQRFEFKHWELLKESDFDWSRLGIRLTTEEPIDGFGPENRI